MVNRNGNGKMWNANACGYWVSSESSDNEKAHQGDDTCVKETQGLSDNHQPSSSLIRNMDIAVPTSPPISNSKDTM